MTTVPRRPALARRGDLVVIEVSDYTTDEDLDWMARRWKQSASGVRAAFVVGGRVHVVRAARAQARRGYTPRWAR